MKKGSERTCTIIAGPNGAGKTTFAMKYLPSVAKCKYFINADLIAAGLSPFAPEAEIIAASRLFLKEIKTCIRRHEDFAFETTLAGRGYLRLIGDLQAGGWQVNLIFLALNDLSLSKQRVAERAAHGGHNIPTKDIERRFSRSLYNLLYCYSHLCNVTLCFENSQPIPNLIFEQHYENREIHNQDLFGHLERNAHK